MRVAFCLRTSLGFNDLIVQGLDNDLATVLIMLDYSKAFDCVDHALLSAKLHYFGLVDRALLFFRCYLEDRKQIVRSHSEVSYVGTVVSGVPQGSILGPLLFILYTFDMSNTIQFSKIHSYADDTQLLYTFNPSDYDEVKANGKFGMQKLFKYKCKHNLKLNAKKSMHCYFYLMDVLSSYKSICICVSMISS